MHYQVGPSPLATLQPAELRVNDLGGGLATLVILRLGEPNVLRRDDGTPAHEGDVLSCQPGGTWQTRPSGAAGGYECCVASGGVATYNPEGPSKPAYVFALQAVPNA